MGPVAPLWPGLRPHARTSGRCASTPRGATSRAWASTSASGGLWLFYLRYCEAGFRTERTNVVQLPSREPDRTGSCAGRGARRRSGHVRAQSPAERHRRHRRHAAHPPAPRQRGHRLRDPGQGRVPQSRPVGEGPRGPVHRARRRSDGVCCGRAAGSSKAPPATPASAWPWSARRSAIAPPSSSRAPRARRRRTPSACSGAELVEVDAVPYSNPGNYQHVSRPPGRGAGGQGAGRRDLGQPVRQRRQPRGARGDHRPGDLGRDRTARSTPSSARSAPAAPWPAWPRRCGREKPGVAIGLADPGGASLYDYYAHGELKAEGTSITEGIGQSRITANLEGLKVDRPYRIDDAGDDGGHLRPGRTRAW